MRAIPPNPGALLPSTHSAILGMEDGETVYWKRRGLENIDRRLKQTNKQKKEKEREREKKKEGERKRSEEENTLGNCNVNVNVNVKVAWALMLHLVIRNEGQLLLCEGSMC